MDPWLYSPPRACRARYRHLPGLIPPDGKGDPDDRLKGFHPLKHGTRQACRSPELTAYKTVPSALVITFWSESKGPSFSDRSRTPLPSGRKLAKRRQCAAEYFGMQESSCDRRDCSRHIPHCFEPRSGTVKNSNTRRRDAREMEVGNA